MATPDDRTRPTHIDIDGEEVDIDEPFSNDCMFPGDGNGPAEEVWCCRCSMRDHIIGFMRANGSISYVEHERDESMHDEQMAEEKERRAEEKPSKSKKQEKSESHEIVNGKDISKTWKRRPDQFAFEIEDVINAQGFDGLPRVVSVDEFDKAVKESNFIAQRTYSAPDQETLDAYRDQLYNGKWYVDCSEGGARFGQGMYTAGNYGTELSKRTIAEMDSYENPKALNRIETLTLSENARIIKYDDLIKQYETDGEEFKDVGSYAAAKGYDVIIARENKHGFYANILNRTKLIIKGE
jgi:hypothetical protein